MTREPPDLQHSPRTYAERRAFEQHWNDLVSDGWERNGHPPEPVNIKSSPRPSIVGSRPGTPDEDCVKIGDPDEDGETGPGYTSLF
jgi:hypothetical protein